MRIKNLKIQNYRKFENLELDFDPRINVIVGPPDSGKTCLLEAVSTILGGYLIRLHRVSSVFLLGEDAFVDGETPRYPISLKAAGTILGQEWEWEKRVVSEFAGEKIYGGMIEFSSLCMSRARRDDLSLVLPLLYFASEQSIPMTAPIGALRARTDGYKNCLAGRVYINTMLNWLAIQMLKEEISPAVQVVCEAMEKAFERFLEIRGKIAVNPKTYDIEVNHIPLKRFGSQILYPVALVGDIAYRMALLNPNLGRMVLLQTGGVILIDELTYHVHEDFEAKFLKLLMDVFPMAQFVVVTSNKDIIQSVSDEQLIVLE